MGVCDVGERPIAKAMPLVFSVLRVSGPLQVQLQSSTERPKRIGWFFSFRKRRRQKERKLRGPNLVHCNPGLFYYFIPGKCFNNDPLSCNHVNPAKVSATRF
ncbi:uncharacterized protein UV8b_00721 [Ustilaginoidea virens]|uniref:Uncharacterized protein n=1 Tax=Ustilaginoidea virens TaxID=1159556 RepID=A0A8E5HJA7_USTVR|nr:uncharacterized protein UV8b_00721 [Ustilaginoidea virens]QUC16480.1 hypothetical protein UV8b_00721 [Ustilaginoidea virens]